MGFFDKLKDVAANPLLSGMIDNGKPKPVAKPVQKSVPKPTANAQKVVPTKPVSKASDPNDLWRSIGCSENTIRFIEMALEDGEIEAAEQKLLYKKVAEDNIDPDEFDFMLTKYLERKHVANMNAVKDLSAAFKYIDAHRDESTVKSVNNDNLITILTSLPNIHAATIGAVVSTFIRTPSKANELKAEVIRTITIPLIPDVVVEFLAYASGQIKQEMGKDKGKGVLTKVSDFISDTELDIIPIWKGKMSSVMSAAVAKFALNSDAMAKLRPYRITPLESLKKRGFNKDYILSFVTPKVPQEFLEVIAYVNLKKKEQSPLKDAFTALNKRLYQEGLEAFEQVPEVMRVIERYRDRAIDEIVNCHDEASILSFPCPEDKEDFLAVLSYTFSMSTKDPEKGADAPNIWKAWAQLNERLAKAGAPMFDDETSKVLIKNSTIRPIHHLKQLEKCNDILSLTTPDNFADLIEVLAYSYDKAKEHGNEWKTLHKRLYREGESMVANDNERMRKLKQYKIGFLSELF